MADGGESLFARLTLSAMRRPTAAAHRNDIIPALSTSDSTYGRIRAPVGSSQAAAAPTFSLHLGAPHQLPGTVGPRATASEAHRGVPALEKSLVGPVPVAPSAFRPAPGEARGAAATVVAAPPVTNHSIESLQHLFTFACSACGARRQRGSHCGGCRTPLPLPHRCGRCGVAARGRFCSTCGLCLTVEAPHPVSRTTAMDPGQGTRSDSSSAAVARAAGGVANAPADAVASNDAQVQPTHTPNTSLARPHSVPLDRGATVVHTAEQGPGSVTTELRAADPMAVPTRLLHSLDRFISEATRSAQSFGVPPRSRSASGGASAWGTHAAGSEVLVAADESGAHGGRNDHSTGTATDGRASIFYDLQSARDVLAAGGGGGAGEHGTVVSDATDQHADGSVSTSLYAAAAAAHGAAVGAVTGFEGHGGAPAWAHEEAAVAQAAAAVKGATDASWAAVTRAHTDVVQGGAAATCTQVDDVFTKAIPRSQSPLLRADALPASSISPRFIETYHHLDLTREERAQAHAAALNPAETAWGPVDLAWRTMARSGPPH